MPVDSFSQFSQFGLGGLVIAALFYQNWSLIKELRSLNESTDKRIFEQANRHNEEREKLYDSFNKLRESYDKLSEVLRVMSERKCPSSVAMERKQNG